MKSKIMEVVDDLIERIAHCSVILLVVPILIIFVMALGVKKVKDFVNNLPEN